MLLRRLWPSGGNAVCCGVELYSQDSGDTGRQISEACLVYRASFRMAGSTQRNYVPKKIKLRKIMTSKVRGETGHRE